MIQPAAELGWLAMQLRNRLVLGAFVDNARMSERELARRAGLSHSTINHLMTGRRTTCSVSTAVAIAQAVQCPIGALFIAEKAAEEQAVNQIAEGVACAGLSNAVCIRSFARSPTN